MREVDLLVFAGTIVTMDIEHKVILNGAIAIDRGIIIEVGNQLEIMTKYVGKESISAKDQYILPGWINTHTHLFQTLLKGLSADMALKRWIEDLINPVVSFLTPEDCYYAALLGMMEAFRSGVSTLLDFNYLAYRPEYSEAIIEAARTAGIRFIYGRGFHDAGRNRGVQDLLIETMDSVLTEVDRLRQYESLNNGMLQIWLAPSVMWGMSRQGLVRMSEYATNYQVPITMHLMEANYDIDVCLEEYGKRPLEVLEEIGVLQNRFLLVHGVKLTKSDQELMVKYDIGFSHCMAANLYLGSGVAPITLIPGSIPVSLGTDGAASNNSQNMMELMKLTALVHKGVNLDPRVISAQRILEMATGEGAKALGREKEIGQIAPGYRADLSIINCDLPVSTPVHDIAATLVYSCDQENVTALVINGKIVMRDRTILTINEQEVIRKVKSIAGRIRGQLTTRKK